MAELLPARRIHLLLLAAAIAVGALLRFEAVGSELSSEEALAWRTIAAPGQTAAAGSNPVPGNHVLHSLLVRAATDVFGPHDWAIRLPALLAGLLTLPAIYALSQSLIGRVDASILAVWILALSPPHVVASSSARGYSLAALFATLSALVLLPAFRGFPRQTVALACTTFLTACALPAAALHGAVLAAWSFIRYRVDTAMLKWLAGAFASASVALLLLHWSQRSGPMEAASAFGVDVWAQPVGPLTIIWETGSLLAGGAAGIAPMSLAIYGFALVVKAQRNLALYVALAWSIPFACALLTGTAAEPRGYLFLLPSFVLMSAYGLAHVRVGSLRWRLVSPAVALAACAALLFKGFFAEPRQEYTSLASHLAARAPEAAVVVAPRMMEEALYHYAIDPLRDNLATLLKRHDIARLQFVTHPGDARSQLGNYLLLRATGPPDALSPDSDDFRVAFSSREVTLLEHRARGELMFPRHSDIAWKPVVGKFPAGTRVAPGPEARSDWPSISVATPAGDPFAIATPDSIAFPGSGLAVLAYARSRTAAEVTLYRSLDSAGAPRFELNDLLRTTAVPVEYTDRRGRKWIFETFLGAVEEASRYGIYIGGSGAEPHLIADIVCVFFPALLTP